MRLLAKDKDIINLVQDLSWSGDTKAVARSLQFTYYQNPHDEKLAKIILEPGNEVILQDDKNKNLFGGVVWTVERAAASGMISVTAYDLMFYINKSEISRIFNNTAEQITRTICNDLGITPGSIAATNTKVYFPCIAKTGYDAIMMAYTAAAKKTKEVYMPMAQSINKLAVIKKGELCGVVVDGSYNLQDATYRVSAENVVNQVLITDKDGNKKRIIEDRTSRNKYGTVQKVYKEEDGKSSEAEAKALMQGIEESGNVTVTGDCRAISGYSIIVQEKSTGLYGKFYIESDSHSFSNGKHTMTLTLAFKNLMDTRELETGG